MIDINLLPAEKLLSPAESRLRRISAITLLSVTILTVLLTAGASLYENILASQVTALETKKNSLTSLLRLEDKTLLEVQTIKTKILGIQAIKKTQPDLAADLQSSRDLIPAVLAINSLNIDGLSREMAFSAVANDVAAFKLLMSRINSPPDRLSLKNPTLSGLELDKDGYIHLSLKTKY